MLTPDRSDGALPYFPGWLTLEKLGEGGMCAVYRCRPEPGEGPERAVKVLTDKSEASVRRFVEEARLLERIDHPNVVKVHSMVADRRPPWLVMDLLGGRDLEATMQVEGPMDPERCARLFADLASGLAAVHAQGVRHRDIKPANIRLGVDGIPRLIDFGIARDASAARVTKAGFVVGTASYLPPEIFTEEDSGAVQDTATADVYALGQTMCEALAGRPVHMSGDRGTEASVLVRIMRDKLDRDFLDPRDFGARIPEPLAMIVRNATTREPIDRLVTARDLEVALRGFLATRGSSGAVAPLTRMSENGQVLLRPPGPAPSVGVTPPPPVAQPVGPAPNSRPSLEPPPPVAAGRSGVGMAAGVGAVAGVSAMAGMGVVGATVLVVAVVAVAGLAGVGGYVWYDRTQQDLVTHDAARLRHALAECRGPRAPSSVRVHVVTKDGATVTAELLDEAPDRVSHCVSDVFLQAKWSTTWPVELVVPVDFR